VSSDGLTWTFHLQAGIRYAPPLQNVEIKAQDFVRALEREARLGTPAAGGYSSYFSVIQGFDAFAQKQAGSISGLQAPDDHTLRVQLSQPASDLGFRLALPATAPIPPDPANLSAEFGAAEGHDAGYGRFLVASGPYKVEGSEHIDPSSPIGEQAPVSGFVPGTSLTLVRSPSWNRSTDDLREAYARPHRDHHRRYTGPGSGADRAGEGRSGVLLGSAPTVLSRGREALPGQPGSGSAHREPP
jgi:ABC-type transport system substrate-binding protein